MTLNDTVWCTIAPSKIHGVGVFAIRDIPKGQKLYVQGHEGKIVLNGALPVIQRLIRSRWPEGKIPLHPHHDAWLLSFMNHSDDPNYDDVKDIAIKDIQAGEEITEDYKQYRAIINQSSQ